tara:strand:- start:348 stop:890 length:543 start_codon:yes stop_codon:yes gene_type:complete
MYIYLAIFIMANIIQQPNIIFEFHKNCDIERWKIIDDVVMGGKSNGSIKLDKNGNGIFSGSVSTENNGGFSSIQLENIENIEVDPKDFIEINLRGDGSAFQFRLKNSKLNRHSYSYRFKTSKSWEKILIPLNNMQPSYRGIKLRIPNFEGKKIESLGFLKSSKVNIDFNLVIKSIKIIKN